MKRYKFIVDGVTKYRNVPPSKEQAFFEKYGQYNPVLVPKFLEEVEKQESVLNQNPTPGKSQGTSQSQNNQQQNTGSSLEDGSLESLTSKIKQSEQKILENEYEQRLASINEQLKAVDGDKNPSKYNELVKNYNSLLKEYEVEYNILNDNVNKYNDIYFKDNPRISSNPVGYSLLDSRFQNIPFGEKLPEYDLSGNDIAELAKRAEQKRADFISSTPNQILTYNTAKEWFDINVEYSDEVRKKVIEEGTHGYNPKTKELFELTESEKNIKQANHNDILKIYRKKYEDGMLSKEEFAEFVENPSLSLPGYKDMSKTEKFILDYSPMYHTGVGRWILKSSMGVGGVTTNITTGLIASAESELILQGAKEGKTIEKMVEDGDISPVHLLQKDVNKITNQFATKHFDEQGRIMTPSDLIAAGRYVDAGTLLAEQSVSQIPSLAISVGGGLMFGPGGAFVGAGILGGSVYGQELVADLERLYIDKGIAVSYTHLTLPTIYSV